MNKTDQHIILAKKAAKGSERAFHQLYELYKQNLFTVCLRYATSKAHAQDYLQEAFITIYKNLNQFDDQKGALYAWMKRITINTCLMDLRKRSLYYVSINEAFEVESSNESVLSDLSMQDMLALIQQLPDGYRTIFNMYVIDGYTHKEIAEELGVSVNTSKTQLMKARNILQKKILANQNISYQQHG